MPFTIKIVGFGNKKEIPVDEITRYRKFLKPYADVSIVTLKSLSGTYGSRHEMLEREGKRMVNSWPARSHTVALSEEGKLFTSISFSQWLSKRVVSGGTLLFNIGGAYGLSPSLKKQCGEVLSLSPLTLPHRLCYVVLVEQLYRAFTILKGHPYHK